MKKESSSAHAHFKKGRALVGLGRSREAERSFESALALSPREPKYALALGQVLRRRGKFRQAIKVLSKALEFQQRNPAVLIELGLAMESVGKESKAKTLIREAYRLDPDDKIISFCYSRLLLRRGHQKAALKALNHSFHSRHRLKLGAQLQPNPFKRAHDREQLSYLRSLGKRTSRIHRYTTRRISESPINPNLEIKKIEDQFIAEGFAVVDGLLAPEAFKELRKFCLESRVWFDQDHGGYLGAHMADGFVSSLHLEIAHSLQSALPRALNGAFFDYVWAFKYGTEGPGIPLHADYGKVNINLWLSPDEANLLEGHGGMVLTDIECPSNWGIEDYNSQTEKISRYLNSRAYRTRIIAHQQNRAVIFNSKLFHSTDRFQFRKGYENRRTNVTFVFGKSAALYR